jgi:hypothetical protein
MRLQRRSTRRVFSSHWFAIVTLLLDAAVAVGAVFFVGSDASRGTQALAAGIGIMAGTALALLVVFLWTLIRAPYKQRDEARAALRAALGQDDDPDPRAFRIEYVDWLRAVDAAQPKSAVSLHGLFDLSRAERARLDSDYNRARDEARGAARAEYHERFKRRMVTVLRNAELRYERVHGHIATAPEELWHLHRLKHALERLTDEPGTPLSRCAGEAESLLVGVEPMHLANVRGEYERWRSRAELIAAEHSAEWAEEFGLHDDSREIASLDELNQRIEADVTVLRRYADEAA